MFFQYLTILQIRNTGVHIYTTLLTLLHLLWFKPIFCIHGYLPTNYYLFVLFKSCYTKCSEYFRDHLSLVNNILLVHSLWLVSNIYFRLCFDNLLQYKVSVARVSITFKFRLISNFSLLHCWTWYCPIQRIECCFRGNNNIPQAYPPRQFQIFYIIMNNDLSTRSIFY